MYKTLGVILMFLLGLLTVAVTGVMLYRMVNPSGQDDAIAYFFAAALFAAITTVIASLIYEAKE
tara:strand:- start:1622 stop:1813 length:192 start_codon:yes stop_codon:yes gene_type:complete